MTRTQFIVAMALHIAEVGRIGACTALNIARDAYRAFEADAGVAFGDAGYAWDREAARILAQEYEIAAW